MAAAKYNITIEQGATFVKSVTVKDATTGVVRDLTGYVARGQIRARYEDQTPIATFNFTNLGTSGTFVFQLSAATTTALDFESAVYDIELEQVGSNPVNVERLMQGNVFLSKEVTK